MSRKTAEELLHELKENPNVLKYLSQYDQKSAEQFLTYYAQTKKLVLDSQESQQTYDDRHYLSCRKKAEVCFRSIGLKKLFNLECKWRAGLINLPIEVSMEFKHWARNIESCEWLGIVTDEEVDCLVQFVRTNAYEAIDDSLFWRDFDELRDMKRGGEGEGYPDWYSAYDLRFGTGNLLALPDVRGQEEERYRDAYFDSRDQESTKNNSEREWLFIDDETCKAFIRAVEPPRIAEYFRQHLYISESEFTVETLQTALELLESEGNPPIPAGVFPDVIFEAAQRVLAKNLEDLIPKVHEGYLERRALNIPHDLNTDYLDMVDIIKNQIEQGKRVLGEA